MGQWRGRVADVDRLVQSPRREKPDGKERGETDYQDNSLLPVHQSNSSTASQPWLSPFRSWSPWPWACTWADVDGPGTVPLSIPKRDRSKAKRYQRGNSR